MQDKQITNQADFSDILSLPTKGRLLALDIGMKKVGVAVSDELQFTVRPLPRVVRKGWKVFLKNIKSLIEEFDAIALVLGLPYEYDGSESEMSTEVRRLHRNFTLSIDIPVLLQDERLTSKSAQQDLYDRGFSMEEIAKRIDSEAATIILEDFISFRDYLKNQKK